MSTIKIIKVNATKSTNSKLRMLIKSKKIHNNTIISANYQYGGRGQSDKRWFSSYGKNLICSLYINIPDMRQSCLQNINFAVSLSVLKTVKKFINNSTLIKWPNDILSANKKISGILIENSIKSNKVYDSIIGTGINVNQLVFKNIPNATSIKKLTNKELNVDIVLDELIKNYNFYFSKIRNTKYLLNQYNENLYGLNKCKFLLEGEIVKGKIIRVLENGKIRVEIFSHELRDYSSKEIKIVY